MAELQVLNEGRLRTLVLDRPARKNALTPSLVEAVTLALADAAADPEVRVVVLTGAEGNFSAGADLGGALGQEPTKTFGDLVFALESFPKPTIAKVAGVARGGAIGIIAACHFALAHRDATFGTPEIQRGLFPFVAMRPILRVVPHRVALEMMLLGDTFDATRAAEIGLITKIVDHLDSSVSALATRLASGPPATTAQALRAMARQRSLSDEEAYAHLYQELVRCLATPDAAEGIQAFLYKRPPSW